MRMRTLIKLVVRLNHFLKGSQKYNPKLASVHKILFIALGGIGDVITKTPAITNLRRAYPEAHIAVLTNVGLAAEVLVNWPCVDRVLFLSREKPKYEENL